MARDILDAKKNRFQECPFCKNPHLAQMASMVGLNIKGKEFNQATIKNKIVQVIAA